MVEVASGRGWRVTVGSAPIRDAGLAGGLPEDLREALVRDRRLAGSVAWGPDAEGRVWAMVVVEAPDVLEAASATVVAVADALRALGAPVGIEVLEVEPEDRGVEPMPELLGASDVAEILGVSRQRIYQLLEREDFPRPVAGLARGWVWRRGDVEEWAVRSRRMA